MAKIVGIAETVELTIGAILVLVIGHIYYLLRLPLTYARHRHDFSWALAFGWILPEKGGARDD